MPSCSMMARASVEIAKSKSAWRTDQPSGSMVCNSGCAEAGMQRPLAQPRREVAQQLGELRRFGRGIEAVAVQKVVIVGG